jgi:hypothetical protein
MEENKDVKCGKCKSYKYPSQFFKNGRRLKTCDDCRRRSKESKERNKCEHGREKSQCKDCGGSCICEHGRQRSVCKECGGASICEHGKLRSTCKECGGGSICEHGKKRSRCKDCGGGSICEHGKLRCRCKDCGGGSICEHGREKSQCKDCGGSICEHGKLRSTCKDCGGGSICEHGKLRKTCKDCDFKGYLSNIVRGRVYKSLKHDKELSSKEYLGCEVDVLKEHIEKQFMEGMSWDNFGEWHIDHIVPLKYNNPSLEEVYERLHYTNTQPLWATDNISKGNRYVG